ncbi:MAG TPA: glycogen-binding domain-containing protein [Verrucomicrobiae bacterium]|nr:glycogen-binding domain-containing protein [Verrucomicrobiae bacterium]
MRKNNHNHKKPNNGTKPIHIEFSHSTASAVAIAGSFNDWRPEPAQLVAKGKWAKELMLPPGTYEYLFVADGTWVPDPRAREAVPNPFGGVNSLLTVTE